MAATGSHEHIARREDEMATLAAIRSADHRTKLGTSLLRFFYDSLWQPLQSAIREAYNKQEYPLGYSPGLDGLRGLMTLGVIAAHVNYSFLPGSVIFMDIFYVMSGYFITGLLIRDVKRHGRVQFFQFYSRRFCRLVPPLAAMVAGFLLFGYLYFPDFKKPAIDAAIGFFYIANWWRAFDWPGISYMGHTWSLAVEEQFYLLWPIIFLILFRLFGIGWRMVGTILTIALAIWAWRIWMTWHGAPFKRLYNGFDTRADALMVGCALAVVLAFVSLENRPTFDRILKLLAWPILAIALTFTFYFLDWQHPAYYYAGIVLGAALGTILVLILIRPLDTVLHRVLELSVLVFFGRIFYAMYLWHWPMVLIFRRDFGWPVWLRFVLIYPLTILLAVLSYVLIERHFMRAKGRRRAAKSDPNPAVAAPGRPL
jgi:peptidoglycan/LPS O-acetylase OafA/YrhL